MKYKYMDPEYWRDVPVLEGVVIALLIVFASICVPASLIAMIWANNYTTFDIFLGALVIYVFSLELTAMAKGVAMRWGPK